jgi:outer membrane protein assembly factor BamB
MKQLAILTATILSATFATAGDTRYVEMKGRQGFLSSQELKGVIVTERGELALADEVQIADIAQTAAAWSGTISASGTIYVGTADGRILSVKEGKASEVFKTDEFVVTSLVSIGGLVYAGTIPAGKIFVSENDGEFKHLTTLPSKYIWQLQPSQMTEGQRQNGEIGRAHV